MMRAAAYGLRRCAVLLPLFLVGCAAGYSLYMGKPLRKLSHRDYSAALAAVKKPDGRTNMVLYRLERGLILHYQRQYVQSNQEFERAERLSDELFTRSASREAAALLTNDAIRPYRGEEFEQVLVHYYRAMNYEYLGKPQDALVECRQANLKLAQYAALAEYELTYKNDPFMQYLTGMIYEAEGEFNDARISYRDAVKGYQALSRLTGIPAPPTLQLDLAGVERRLGDEVEVLPGRQQGPREAAMQLDSATPEGIIAFVETGFVGRKHQYEIQLPILEGDEGADIWMVSDRLAYRYRYPYVYRRSSVKYWLQVALPEYRPVPSVVAAVRIRAAGRMADGILVEDISAIARQTFADKENTILVRTAARAVAKYFAARGVRRAFQTDDSDSRSQDVPWKDGVGKLLGVLVNLFGVATEAADTRGWLALPARIYMARLPLVPGAVDLQVDFLDLTGRLVETQVIPTVMVRRNAPTFVNCRGYR